MDITSSAKNLGSSAFGSSSSGSSGSGDSGGGMFSGFMNLSIQKMVLISVGTVAILLWKSKSSQKWPPEISKCPDRMEYDGTKCVDNYGLLNTTFTPGSTNCDNFNAVKGLTYKTTGMSGDDTGYIPWEGILDGQKSRASSLKCLT
jgi:hypothetical protein